MLKQRLVICYIIYFSTLLTGCAHDGLFQWGDYENSLYQRYVENNAEQADSYLQQTLDDAISSNRVPPGLYADYGFILYQQGNKNAAIDLFNKEKSIFPESSALMSKLIDKLKQQTVQTNPNAFTSDRVKQ